MIHGSSSDPVLLKRIGLRVWSLRDEIEAVVSKIIANNGDSKKLTPEQLQQIKDEYEYKGELTQRAPLSLVPQQDEAQGESEEEASEEADNEELDASEDSDEASTEEPSVSDDAQSIEMSNVKVIQRTSQNIAQSKVSRGISFLSELSMDTLYFFSNEYFTEGQSIVIEFVVPKTFVLNAKVRYCRAFNKGSKIISNKKVSYRVVIDFTFLKEGERTLLRDFIRSIEPDIPAAPAPKPKKAKAAEEDDDDDFDGLEGLDF